MKEKSLFTFNPPFLKNFIQEARCKLGLTRSLGKWFWSPSNRISILRPLSQSQTFLPRRLQAMRSEENESVRRVFFKIQKIERLKLPTKWLGDISQSDCAKFRKC